MGEIKSTIDIIMEKLKKIDIDENEKRKIIKKEAKEIAKKLMVRYIEKPTIEQIINELNSLKPEKKEETKKALIDECMVNIYPHSKTNEDILRLMEALINKKLDSIRKLLSSIEERLQKEKKIQEQKIIEHLKNRDIYGSAIIPNVEAYSEWNKKFQEIKEELHLDMNNLISEL